MKTNLVERDRYEIERDIKRCARLYNSDYVINSEDCRAMRLVISSLMNKLGKELESWVNKYVM